MTGRRVWWYFVAFFSLILAVNAVMVTLAIRTHSGIVTDHPYEKGLAYNRVVDAEQQQEALGWKGRISYQNGVLDFALYDAQHRAVIPEEAMASFTRPTQQGMDFTVMLKGRETPIDFPARGLWEVRIDAVHEGMHYQQAQRIVVK